jgi:hypothetical protein
MAVSDPKRRSTTVAMLYELWTLDVVTDVGEASASLFEAHPQQFKNVRAVTADTLATLRYRLGNDEYHLDADQRRDLLTPLLGASDGTRHDDVAAAFHQAAQGVRQAAVDFVQRSFDSGERQLRNAFRDAAKSLHSYLTTVEGSVAASAARRVEQHFGEVVSVLQDASFAGGLGLPPAPKDPWPRFGELGGDGAALIEAIDRRASELGLVERSPLDRAEFVAVQRIADQGAAALDAVFGDPSLPKDDVADEAINVVYRWWTAIRDLRSGE